MSGRGAAALAQTPRRQRRDCFSPTDVRPYREFQDRDRVQIDCISFDFPRGTGRAEMPLLAHNFCCRTIYSRLPSKGELLRSLGLCLIETKLDTVERNRLIEDDADLLLTFLGSAPAR